MEAPRDFETSQPKLCPSLKLNNSYHLRTLMSSLKLTQSWLLLAFCDVIFLPWAQFRHSLRAIFYVGVSNVRAQSQAQTRYKFGGIKNTMPWDFLKILRVVFMGKRDNLARERAQSGTVKTSISRFSTNILPPSFQIAFLRLAT